MSNPDVQPETAPAEEKKSALDAFLKPQQTALEETGKAFASLLPREFRDHAQKALDENRASMEVLWDGLIEGIESGLEKMRPRREGEAASTQGKVKVDVE